MIPEPLTSHERQQLLILARRAIERAVACKEPEALNLANLSRCLQEPGTAFVTLTIAGKLRGCIGGLEVTQSLAEDVREHAIAAALHDYRFPPVCPEEVNAIKIEISRLTPLQKVNYSTPQDLLGRLHPKIDGVVLSDGVRRATFLPQVWEKLPEPELFLSYLCAKMGASQDIWRTKPLQIWVYQVEEFHEGEPSLGYSSSQ
jgi:uncharacterized protein